MKLIIAGSRSWSENDDREYARVVDLIWDFIAAHLFSTTLISEVVSGDARGVDRIGAAWAKDNNIPVKKFEADWQRIGLGAGHVRNRWMADYADAAFIIWDGISKGSLNMYDEMILRKKPVVRYNAKLNKWDVSGEWEGRG